MSCVAGVSCNLGHPISQVQQQTAEYSEKLSSSSKYISSIVLFSIVCKRLQEMQKATVTGSVGSAVLIKVSWLELVYMQRFGLQLKSVGMIE
ncbi:hypothetical protein CFP56_017992 [Quercus suber]|uniref:Uncharacterized protein n=1 Tax=Quercus suber TaxID=58331 RepID=A0AAW0KM42_QUESU